MFAETESEELLNLLSQVRLVADEEARIDGAQQQQSSQPQQQFHDQIYMTKPSAASATSLSTATGAVTTAHSSPVGRYTASSTAATVSWTVHDSNSSVVAGTIKNHHHQNNSDLSGSVERGGGGYLPQPFLETNVGRTPATGVKVLHQQQQPGDGVSLQPSDVYTPGGEVYADDYDDVLQQPKQLFFMDARDRAALQQQQRQIKVPIQQGSALPSVLARSNTSLSPNSSIQSCGVGVGIGVGRPLPTTGSELPQPTMESISAVVEEESGNLSRAFPRDRAASLGSAGVMSAVLSGYTQSLKEEGLGNEEADANGEGGVADKNNGQYEASRDTGGVLKDTWTVARGINGVPLSSMDDSSACSPRTYTRQQQQQFQQETPAKTQPYSASSTSSSPLFAVSLTKTANYTNSAVARAAHSSIGGVGGAGSVATTPIHAMAPAIPRSQQLQQLQLLQQQQKTLSPAPMSAEAAVGSLLRADGVGPEVSGSAPNVVYPPTRRIDVLEHESAWRVSVEAELNELQCAGPSSETATGDASGSTNYYHPNSNNVQKYGTPTTTISPLAPTSTTPYHQLLSQLRYSPPQQQSGGGGGGGVRSNTPPDRRAFTLVQPGMPLTQRATSDTSAPVVCGGGTSRYTANVTCASPFTTTMEGVINSSNTNNNTIDGLTSHSWLQAGLSPAEAAALWNRMSPYEKAAAAAAAATTTSSSMSISSTLFHTPDTVAKPVTLSSIAAHLQDGEMGTPDDLAYLSARQQRQQQQQRYSSPAACTTAVASPKSLLRRQSSSSRLCDAGLSNGATHLLFPTPPQQQQPRPPPPQTMMMSAPGNTPAGPSVPPSQQGWVKHLSQSSGYTHTGAPRSATTTTMPAGAVPSRNARLPPQQQFQSPTAFRRGSPDETTATAGSTANNNSNSPPSCSLRPSPQTRGSDGSSPALRRYIITTPNTHANTAGNGSSTNKRSGGGGGSSPLGQYGNTNNAHTGTAAAREARPRVQLTHMAGGTASASANALRSPLNNNASPPPSHHRSAVCSPSASSTRAAALNSGGGGGGMASLHHNSNHSANNTTGAAAGMSSTAAMVGSNFNAVSGVSAGSATSVSPVAVRALIERLQAVAPAVLYGSPTAAAAAAANTSESTMNGAAVDADSLTATSPVNAKNNNNSSGGLNVPDVASASVILSMSHDQHGCRLLQAVLDFECGNAEDSTTMEMEEGKEVDSPGEKSSPDPLADNGNNNSPTSTTESNRRHRADAFYRSTAVQVILRAIEPKLDAVMADGYGNFLLQKVFDMAPDAERQRLLRLPSLQHHLCEVACSPHGTFAVQRLVETVRNTEEERLVFVALERDVLRLLTNANGGHVLMKVMECIRRQYTALASSPSENANNSTAGNSISPSLTATPSSASLRSLLQDRVDAIFTVMQQNLMYVCQHKQGCCIAQKCLDFLNACSGLSPSATTTAVTAVAAVQKKEEEAEEKDAAMQQQPQPQSLDYFERMCALLLPHVQELSVDPFGNYVVTRLVDVSYTRGNTATIDAVAMAMQRHLVRMCTNKFASNVVEHILRHCSERRIRSICQTLMMKPTTTPQSSSSSAPTAAQMAVMNPAIASLPLTTVVMDSYGNYVVQTLLTVAPVDELASVTSVEGGILPVLQQLLPLLSSRNFGRKLETKTELALLRVEQYHHQQQQQQRRRM